MFSAPFSVSFQCNKSIIVDATHTLSRSNPFSGIDVLRERSKLLRKTVYLFDNRFKENAIITSGDKGDSPELPKLLEISQENGIDVDDVIGDGAYTATKNLQLATGQNIRVVARLNVSVVR